MLIDIRIKWLCWAASMGILMLASGCSNDSSDKTFESASGGQELSEAHDHSGDKVLRFGISNDIPRLILGSNQGAAAETVLGLVHRGLMVYGQDGEMVPGIAKKVIQESPVKYRFDIRTEAKFPDGSKITADVIKKNLEYHLDKSNGSAIYNGIKGIESIQTKDNSIILNLDEPNTSLLSWLATPEAGIVPEDSLNGSDNNLVGAGPFKLKEYREGIDMTLEKDPNFYDSEKVNLDKIVITFYPDDQARVNALLSDDVDFIDYVPWSNWDQVENDSNIKIAGVKSAFQYVQFNVTEPPFDNKKVRQAVAFAVDRKNSIQVFEGHAEVLDGVALLKSDAAYNPDLEHLWKKDLSKSEQLLKDADFNFDQEVTLLTTSQYTFLQDLAISVQSDLKKIGMKVKLDAPDWAGRVKKGNEGKYNLAVSGSAPTVPDASYLYQFAGGADHYYNGSFGYSNSRMDELFDQLRKAQSDQEKQDIFDKIQLKIKDEVPFVSLNQRFQGFAFNKRVKGFVPLANVLWAGYPMEYVDIAD